MTKIALSVVSLSLVILGCSASSDPESSGCTDISGNYKVESTRLSGSCPPDPEGGYTASVIRAEDGWVITYPGIENGCPGTLDSTCKFTSTCKLTNKETGETMATLSYEHRFSGRGFEGTSVTGIMHPFVEGGCTANYRDTGTKL